ncbi:ATP-binding protein [Metabacillus fastidiosus]|uniref:ATP-binding protein n=1 Tax=Metabacillus fastidiosus TaxID=1458 RepID=UPI002E1BE2DF|nr:ATP-binding protein [Metabacillus fastidiosus]
MDKYAESKQLVSQASWTKAEYREQQISEYSGNPLIEALPPILNYREAYQKMMVEPLYSDKERELSEELRYQILFRLQHFFQPVAQHIDLEKRFSRLIRTGYLSRNPLSTDEIKYLRGSSIQKLNSASSFTLMGFSGIGKTTAIERVLSLYPQVILHKYPINRWQIVWMKLNCPHDGSLKTLCMDFFLKIDELIGTSYYEKYGNTQISISAMITQMGRIARIHCIGALIIDEIQHLLTARDRGSEKMMNFFVTLINEIGIPIMLIGTMKARAVLQQDFRQARRGSGQGDMIWENMEFDDDWNMLIEEMWKLQWTRENVPLNEELSQTLYEESQGIVDIAVKIFSLAQSRAIETGIEKITPALIKAVVKDDLKLVEPMLNALRSGFKTDLEKYPDIMPTNLSKLLVMRKSKIDLKASIQKEKEEQEKKNREYEITAIEKAIHALITVGIEAREAEKAITSVLRELKTADSSTIVAEAINYIKQRKEKVQMSKEEKRQEVKENYLSSIIEKGEKKKLSAYKSLLDTGYIKQPLKELVI